MTKDIRLSRRSLLAAGAAGAAALAFPMPFVRAQTPNFSGKTLRLLTWSDDTGLAALENIAKTFEELTGAKVIADRTGSTSEMVAKLKASGERPQYDVITLAGVGAYALADAGLLEKPDLNQLPNLKDVDPRFQTGADGHGIGYLLWTDGLIYNTQTFATPPKSYQELWDEKYAQRLFLPPSTYTEAFDLIITAARLTGGDISNPESGFEKLAELRDRVLTFGENPTQIAELFRSNSLDIGGVYSPAFLVQALKDPSYNVGATLDLEEGFYADLMYTIMPKSRPGESEVAHAFINHSLDPKVQGAMAEAVLNGPVNTKAILSDTAKASPFIVKPELLGEKAIMHDKDSIAAVRDEWIKRYTQVLS
jgi:putative spermidine/putrescine transport system substrate-binding protein